MANSQITFKDNRVKIAEIINNKSIGLLYEVKDSLVLQTESNTPSATGQLKRSFGNDSFVDEDALVAYIGSSLEHSLWVEMGTGEYAVEGGRKGGWWIKVGNGKNEIPLEVAKKYGWAKVQRDSYGNPTFVFTYGMKPKRMLYKAYQAKKGKIKRQVENTFKELNRL